ncbi:hypothetical protein IAE19_16325 [Acinetobacter sp. S40]|uniref:hypothetical protein n=1 Tax=Acinetobacter sp. S40 TaxID=2767434 RepID=UPI00190E114B|nr:hypothetical protein [Acinetobacter sp. S40]MBJ9986998.1 hypothetical protein [Acinetobacter sp. S40]
MPNYHKLIYLSFLFLAACGEDGNYSAGVSLGGTGTGPLGNGEGGLLITDAQLPKPSDDIDPELIHEYIIWSNGAIESQCGDVKVSIQLLHNQTKQPLEYGQGSVVSTPTDLQPTNVSVQITTENLIQHPVFEYLTECKPNLKLEDQFGNEYKSNQEYICANDSLVREYGPLQKNIYHYSFSVPLAESKRTILYQPDFSSKIQLTKEQRQSCTPLIYEINIERY